MVAMNSCRALHVNHAYEQSLSVSGRQLLLPPRFLEVYPLLFLLSHQDAHGYKTRTPTQFLISYFLRSEYRDVYMDW